MGNTNIFGGYAGRVVGIASADTFYIPLGLVVGDFKDNLGVKGLITGLSFDGQSGYQVIHTLRQYQYIYTFGERVGDITVSGLLFNADCTGTISPNPGNLPDFGQFVNLPGGGGATGLARFYDWYERNRISTTGAPIVVTLTPNLTLSAFLVAFKFEIEDPSISLGRFAMKFFYPPRFRSATAAPQFPPPSTTGTDVPLDKIELLLNLGGGPEREPPDVSLNLITGIISAS